MGIDHTPRDKQAGLDQPSLWVDQPTNAYPLCLRVPFEDEHFGMTNTATTCTRCLKRMPGCEGFWLSSTSRTRLIQANTAPV